MAHRRITTKPLLAAIGAGVSFTATAEPPPFLPPSLQRVVEEAHERNAVPQAHERNAEIDDLRAVSEGGLTLGAVIEQLGADDLETRDRASAVLADVAMWDEEILGAACRLPDICPETRERLRVAMFDRFLNAPKPAVGITMSRSSRFGIAVLKVEPGFPSGRVLRADDEILKIGEVDFRPNPRDSLLLQTAVASYDPGDTVEMLLFRDNKEFVAQVELGEFTALGGRAGPRSMALYRRAFHMRLDRKAIDLFPSEPLAAPISRIDWDRAARRPIRASEATDLLAGGTPYPIPGRPSGGGRANNNLRAVRAERARDEVKGGAPNPAANAVLVQVAQVNNTIDALRERLNDPRTSRDDRAILVEKMEEFTKLRQTLLEAINNR